MNATEVLIAARKLCEEKWGQAKPGDGLPDGCVCAYTATAFELSGGNNAAMWEADRLMRLAIGVESPSAVWHWNDHPSRTLADVLAAFDRAIEMSKEAS